MFPVTSILSYLVLSSSCFRQHPPFVWSPCSTKDFLCCQLTFFSLRHFLPWQTCTTPLVRTSSAGTPNQFVFFFPLSSFIVSFFDFRSAFDTHFLYGRGSFFVSSTVVLGQNPLFDSFPFPPSSQRSCFPCSVLHSFFCCFIRFLPPFS